MAKHVSAAADSLFGQDFIFTLALLIVSDGCLADLWSTGVVLLEMFMDKILNCACATTCYVDVLKM